MLVTGPLQYVLYPDIAGLREDSTTLTAMFLLLTRVLGIGILPAVGLVAMASEPIFHLLLSKKWDEVAPIFILIAPAAALQPVTAIVGTFLMAVGRTDIQLRLAMQFAAVWFIGLMLSVWYGIEAVAAAYCICSVCFSLRSLRICLPFVHCSFTVYAPPLWPMTLTAAAILLYWLVSSTAPAHERAQCVLSSHAGIYRNRRCVACPAPRSISCFNQHAHELGVIFKRAKIVDNRDRSGSSKRCVAALCGTAQLTKTRLYPPSEVVGGLPNAGNTCISNLMGPWIPSGGSGCAGPPPRRLPPCGRSRPRWCGCRRGRRIPAPRAWWPRCGWRR